MSGICINGISQLILIICDDFVLFSIRIFSGMNWLFVVNEDIYVLRRRYDLIELLTRMIAIADWLMRMIMWVMTDDDGWPVVSCRKRKSFKWTFILAIVVIHIISELLQSSSSSFGTMIVRPSELILIWPADNASSNRYGMEDFSWCDRQQVAPSIPFEMKNILYLLNYFIISR